MFFGINVEIIRAFCKLLLFGILVLSYFILTAPLLLVYKILPVVTRKLLCRILQIYSKACLKIFSIEVDYKVYLERSTHHFIVCNHLSYLDIMIVAARFPTMFVTSMEMKKTPFLGQICTLGGCLFVDRRSRENRHKELRELEDALNSGLNITVFPEATSTDGSRVKQFKMALFDAAIRTQTPILPLCLNYCRLDYCEINKNNRDKVFWYDEMTFFAHFWSMLKCRRIQVRLHQGETILPSYDCKKLDLADRSREIVTQFYRPITL
ncbi:1-acyl-sn-glycerol-3-phosphate acyltransferase [Bacteriovorax sp. DB6_IX]|uniref:lysophospholipid acyltransferase family protein n=1 Tax=Bacteriovorax sp. DB6_IX TaxID=1353530 RepID=UPI000389F646|nr:lysophospholipid acyltransferase family protein [Bacteriovorax sp. DB6_IX]EQC51972.1 acyltransferase [Bacteriovorax sp. DB6_IX]